jgi:hypothetical protein
MHAEPDVTTLVASNVPDPVRESVQVRELASDEIVGPLVTEDR